MKIYLPDYELDLSSAYIAYANEAEMDSLAGRWVVAEPLPGTQVDVIARVNAERDRRLLFEQLRAATALK